jgi:predicted Zn-dependent protease with MMP-like domain
MTTAIADWSLGGAGVSVQPAKSAAAIAREQKSKRLRGKNICAKLAGLDYQGIRKEVAKIVDRLPRHFRERLSNVEFVVEKRPSMELLRAAGLNPRIDTLYGIYQGIPLPDRSQLDPPLLPDKITIFAEPLLEHFPDPDELREEIRLTVLHEIAHYFGMDEDEIDDLGY